MRGSAERGSSAPSWRRRGNWVDSARVGLGDPRRCAERGPAERVERRGAAGGAHGAVPERRGGTVERSVAAWGEERGRNGASVFNGGQKHGGGRTTVVDINHI